MKNFWKWILGIVIVLVVLFALGIGARLLLGNTLPARMVDFDGFRSPIMGTRGLDCINSRVPMGGMMTFGGGSMLLGWLVPLGLVGLLAYGAYRLGMGRSAAHQAPVAPLPLRTCTKCGQQVDAGWSHCAYCGKKL